MALYNQLALTLSCYKFLCINSTHPPPSASQTKSAPASLKFFTAVSTASILLLPHQCGTTCIKVTSLMRRGVKDLAGCLACWGDWARAPPVAGSGLGHCALPRQALAVAFASWSQAFGARRCRIYSHRTCVLVSLYAERLHFFSKIYFYFSSSVTLRLHQNDTTMLE